MVGNVCLFFKTLGEEGRGGFYKGRIARAISECARSNGGVLSEEDLARHTSTFDDPIKTTYRGVDVWEMPPNGQGITALVALNILEGFNFSSMFLTSKPLANKDILGNSKFNVPFLKEVAFYLGLNSQIVLYRRVHCTGVTTLYKYLYRSIC